MGQKVHPNGMRVGIIRSWNSSWFAGKHNYAKILHDELAIRKYLKTTLDGMSVSKVEISINSNVVDIKIHSGKPGMLIGQQGAKIEELKEKLTKKFGHSFSVDVIEVKKPSTDATIVGETIAKQIERRISYRRAAKAAIEKAMEQGARGIKVLIGGRLNGAEIARSEFFTEGKIPLHTLRADIDYVHTEAHTTYGLISVKVWIYQGEVFTRGKNKVA
jgi:small subunit ribosomal protein S3